MKRILPLLIVLAVARVASAQNVNCDTLPNPIYLQVGDTQANLMKRLGRALRANTNKMITLVWQTSPSCDNITAFYNDTARANGTTMRYAPSTSDVGGATWVVTDDPFTCNLTVNTPLDIANSAIFNSACASIPAQPATVQQTHGPVQAYVMAVPEASSQTAITLQEAFFVFGFGMGGMITPWDDEALMFTRGSTTSTLIAWAANIGIPVSKFKGTVQSGSGVVVTKLQGASNPEKAIGLLGAEVYDAQRATLNVLAYRAKDQYAAYYPDSTASARDKINVRDGHYTVWSPTIWMDHVSGTTPTKLDARYVVDLIAGHTVTPAINFDMNAIVAAIGLVPDCAMKVKREFEGGPLSLYTPAESCTCKYESLVQTSSCAVCDMNTPCASGVCRNGFCEVQ